MLEDDTIDDVAAITAERMKVGVVDSTEQITWKGVRNRSERVLWFCGWKRRSEVGSLKRGKEQAWSATTEQEQSRQALHKMSVVVRISRPLT